MMRCYALNANAVCQIWWNSISNF